MYTIKIALRIVEKNIIIININAKVKHIIRKHHITWRNIRDRDLNYEQEELGGINFKFIHITHVVIVCLQIARHKTDVLSCVPTSRSSVRLAYAIPNVFSYLNDKTFINGKLQIDYIDTFLKMYGQCIDHINCQCINR